MTQGQLEEIPVQIGKIFSDLEIRIMSDIVRRIKINGFSTASADWQMTRLQQLGKSEEDIKEWIRIALEASDAELELIFSDKTYVEYMKHERAYQVNGMEQIPFEENQELQQLIESVKQQTRDSFKNITGTIGFVKQEGTGLRSVELTEFYRITLDNAITDIHSGAFDYQTVLMRTINDMTKSGLRWIDYGSKRHNRVDVAARMTIMTGFRQVQGQINQQVAEQLGTDSYEVTYHVGARPDHQLWQGKVWTMQQLKAVCGLGTVTGLHGANCYHDYNAFIPGISVRTYTDKQLGQMIDKENTPKEYNGKQYTTYEALQQQRKMERNMRKTRQDIRLMEEGEADEQSIMLKKGRYYGQMQTYVDFSEKMDLPQQRDRIYQDGLKGNFSSKKAFEKMQKEKVETVEKKIKSDTMESELGVFKQRLRKDSDISKKYYSALKNKFAHGKEAAKKVFNKTVPNDSVEKNDFEGTAIYDTKTKKISMYYGADVNNPRGAGATWFHEHGHLIDDYMNQMSDNQEYATLLREDAMEYRLSYGKKHNIKSFDKVDKAISNELKDMRRHSSVSDIFDGVTSGNIRGVAGHSAEYWQNTKNITAEAFAHMYEAQFDEVRYSELKKYFPKSLDYFEKKLKEAAK